MPYRQIFHTKLIRIYFFARYLWPIQFRKPRTCFLPGVAIRVKLGWANFSTCEMFTVIKVIVLRALVIIQSYQCTLHRITKVLLVNKRVCTKDYLKYYLFLMSLLGFLWAGKSLVWIYRRSRSACLPLVWERSHKLAGCWLLLCKTFLKTIQHWEAYQPCWKAFKCLLTCHFE